MSILIKGMDMPKEGTYILNFISSEEGKHTICLIEKEHDDGGAEKGVAYYCLQLDYKEHEDDN